MAAYYIGLDLTDLSKHPARAVDYAILDESLECSFGQWHYRGSLEDIIPPIVQNNPFVMAIDGPQGLAGTPGARMRVAEKKLGTPGKSPYGSPHSGPFAGYVRGSVHLFRQLALEDPRFILCGLEGSNGCKANLIEVYPGHAWQQMSGRKLSKKTSAEGRGERMHIVEHCGVTLPDRNLPTHDQLDAAIAAWTAYRYVQGRVHLHGHPPFFDSAADIIREGYIVEPQ